MVADYVEQRWERVIAVTKWLGILLAVLAAYDVYDGDDLGGVVMTVAPPCRFQNSSPPARLSTMLVNGIAIVVPVMMAFVPPIPCHVLSMPTNPPPD